MPGAPTSPSSDAASARVPPFSRRPVQYALIAGVGLYLFTICAAYMSRAPLEAPTHYAVLGPEVINPGGEFPLRLVAYSAGSRSQTPVRVIAATMEAGGSSTAITPLPKEASVPNLLVVPAGPQEPGPFEVHLTLAADGDEGRKLRVPLSVYVPGAPDKPQPAPLPSQVPASDTLLIDLLTEGPGLAMAQKNRVWLRVTDPAGAPVPDVELIWTMKGAKEKAGRDETDLAGVVSATVTPNHLTTTFQITAVRGEESGKLETSRTPSGRSVTLWPDRMIQARGEGPIEVGVRRADKATGVFCDLYRDTAWLRSWHVPADAPRTTTLKVDLPAPDVYRFQCYGHFAIPGAGGDAMWLFGTPGPRHKAVRRLLTEHPGTGRMGKWLAGLPAIDSASRTGMLTAYRTSDVILARPELLTSTRRADLEATRLATDTQRIRYFLLIGASFALVILWAIYYAVNTAILSRRRMAEAMAELGDLAVPIPPPTGLMQARKVVQVVFVLAVLTLNVLAMLELFKYL